ncbi:acyl-CoA dehydrogenase family protein [Lentzea roselyniae]|uniref:acyl-CoA dehydrogenase family protein n=1 Tax=Lentzea roselyniae TaxID=531940 RepID=UPI003D157EE3
MAGCCTTPAERVVGGDGLTHSQRYLNYRRLILTCLVTGLMRALLERCVTRLRKTVRHGTPVTDLPNVQAAVAGCTSRSNLPGPPGSPVAGRGVPPRGAPTSGGPTSS